MPVAVTGVSLSGNTDSMASSWKFSTTSAEAWEDMLESCRGAEKSIDLEQYIFGSDGPIIEEWSALLKEKARRGVKIRLLFDALGSFSFFRSSLCAELRKCGIAIAFHKITLSPSVRRFVPFILRDHRKLLVVDGREAHIGGVIIEERARNWRDTSTRLAGEVVSDCKRAFDIAWERTSRMRPLGQALPRNGKAAFYLAGNSFHLHDKELYRIILRHIASAKKEIFITTPYFSLTRDLRRAFYFARSRNVEISILLPRRSDNFLADLLGRLYYRRLLRRGVRLFHYTENILHAKTIVVDGRFASVGSCNFDWLSFRLNYELNVMSEEKDFAVELREIFLMDIAKSPEVSLSTPIFRGFFGA